MVKATTSTKLHKLLPNNRLGLLTANVKVGTTTSTFREYITEIQDHMALSLQDVRESELPVIKESRTAYKVCGKEPSRYRPSAEALLRRLRTKRSLYEINNVVDTINLTSISTQFSIGGFDFSKIQGEIICDIGDAAPYLAIGRGELNIADMPGLRDDLGFFGTPTSDSERTMVTADTTKLLLVFYDFYKNKTLQSALDFAATVLTKHCFATDIQIDLRS